MPNVAIPSHPMIGETLTYRPDHRPIIPYGEPDFGTVVRPGDYVTILSVFENWNDVAGLDMYYVYVPATGYHTHVSPSEAWREDED